MTRVVSSVIRFWFEQSFSQDVFNPKIKIADTDYVSGPCRNVGEGNRERVGVVGLRVGEVMMIILSPSFPPPPPPPHQHHDLNLLTDAQGLSEEHVMANRERDYAYAMSHYTKDDVEAVEASMRLKLQQRTKTGGGW
jgi:hypothetical protein